MMDFEGEEVGWRGGWLVLRECWGGMYFALGEFTEKLNGD